MNDIQFLLLLTAALLAFIPLFFIAWSIGDEIGARVAKHFSKYFG